MYLISGTSRKSRHTREERQTGDLLSLYNFDIIAVVVASLLCYSSWTFNEGYGDCPSVKLVYI